MNGKESLSEKTESYIMQEFNIWINNAVLSVCSINNANIGFLAWCLVQIK